MTRERVNEIIGILFFAASLFLLWSLFTYTPTDNPFYTSHPNQVIHNGAGLIGSYIAHYLMLVFGVSSYTFPLIFIFWSASFLWQRVPEKLFYKIVGFLIFQSSTAALFSLVSFSSRQFTMGGVLGYFLSSNLSTYFGFGGGLIISLACFCLSFILATEYLIFPFLSTGFSSLVEGVARAYSNFITYRTRKKAPPFVGTKSKKEKKEKPIKETKKKVILPKKSGSETIVPVSKVDADEKIDDDEEIDDDIDSVTIDEREKKKRELFENVPELKVKKYDPEAVINAQINQEKIQKEIEAKQKTKLSEIEEQRRKKEDDDKPVVAVYSESSATGDAEKPFEFPPLDMLRKPEAVHIDDDLAENSRILESCLKDFDIDVKVTEVEQGPVITRYELLPAPGIKLSRITGLQDDIALALKAKSIRIIAPIPGKAAVGIEVPNSTTNTVFLRELLATLLTSSKRKKIHLPLVFGKEISGKALIADLTSMPHLLIAGSTGSGKTVCINALIISLMYFLTPDQLKFIMVDPKRVELAQYNDIPYLLSPVVTDVKKAASTLNWVVTEMDNRYKLFAEVGVRNIQSYNERDLEAEATDEEKVDDETDEGDESMHVLLEDAATDDETDDEIEAFPVTKPLGEVAKEKYPRSLPYIVVIIDELADLMMVAADKVETSIARLAQLARATGIHLILATQRPSVDVLTGVIKSNFPARVSFKVASKTDSRTVLDANGADKLLGKGDMLFLEPGREKPIRAQATLITDAEIDDVVSFVKKQSKVSYNKSVQEASSGKVESLDMDKDDLYNEAVRIVLETRQASVSILQRRLRLGYNRAGRIIDMMESEGIVGPHQGSKPREILVEQD
jgi:S-DNA-T family DNA segregation ATPase FtsK/SpoIIIE